MAMSYAESYYSTKFGGLAITNEILTRQKSLEMERLCKSKITCNGETHSIKDWGIITGFGAENIRDRIKHGWKPEDAITKPIICNDMTAIYPNAVYFVDDNGKPISKKMAFR